MIYDSFFCLNCRKVFSPREEEIGCPFCGALDCRPAAHYVIEEPERTRIIEAAENCAAIIGESEPDRIAEFANVIALYCFFSDESEFIPYTAEDFK